MEESTHDYLSRIGRKGGTTQGNRNKLKGKEYFSNMGKLGVKARNEKKLKEMQKEVTIDKA